MTATAWAHLPNAVHIDRVIAIANVSPRCRAVGWEAAWNAAWHDMNIQHRQAAWMAAWDAVRGMVRVQSRDAEWDAARDAVLALCAYDDCAYMLDSDPGELAILAAFGDHRAILLLSACKVFYLISQLT